MFASKGRAAAQMDAQFVGNNGIEEKVGSVHFRYDFELLRANGEVERWSAENLVTTVGGNDLLDKYFAGSAYTAAWYLGLIGASTTGPVIGDTMASHGGWVEASATQTPNYGSATRPAINFGTAAANKQKVSQAAVNFTFSETGTVKGAFIAANNTKGGTTGILYSASTFTDRPVNNTDQLNVTVTVSV